MATYQELLKRRNMTAQERAKEISGGVASYGVTGGIPSTQAQAPTQGMTGEETVSSVGKAEKKNKGGLFGGIGYTLEQLGLGVVRSVEGVVDYVGGGLLDLFGADDTADEWMKSDWVNYNHANEWYNPDKGWEYAGELANGVGGVLPTVALNYATGGTAGAVIGSAMFGTGAAGQAVSDQTKKSGSAGGKEWLYGTASGAMETAIEAISGGIGGTAAGKVLGKQLAKSTGGKVASAFIGEGLEEVASDILNPALQRVTGVDKTAKVDWGNLPRTFLVGGGVGAVMGGAGRVANAAKVGGFNNLGAMETAQEIDERMSDNNVRQALGKKEIYTQADMAAARDRLSRNLQKMDEETRSAFLAEHKRIAPIFNADGTVKQEVWENARFATPSEKIAAPMARNDKHSESQAERNDGGARYSVKNVDGKDIVSIDTDQNVFEGVARKDYGKVAREYIKSHFRGNSVNDVAFTRDSEREYTQSKYSKQLYAKKSPTYDTKMKASTELDNFVRTGEFIRHEKANHPHSYNEGGYDRYAVEFELGGESFTGEMLVAKNSDNKAMFYDIVNIKESDLLTNRSKPEISAESLSTSSIREKRENVNRFSQKNVKTNSQSIGNLANVTYSSSLKGRESTLKYQPVAAEQATEHAKTALRNIELISGGRVDVVLTSELARTADGQQVNGEYADGVLYVNANADSYERAMFIASHEMTHTLEGTEAYEKLGEFIGERLAADPALAGKYALEKYRAAYDSAQAADFSEETLEYQAKTELYADFVAREILGNEDVVRRFVAKQRNIAARFLEWVRSALRRLGGGREQQEEYKALKKAEKLLSAAIESARGGVMLEEVEDGVQAMNALKSALEGEKDEISTPTSQARNDKHSESQPERNDGTEQKENTDKKNPTKNPDIRYSIDVENTEKARRNAGYAAALRNYLHRLNISEEVKADVIEKYGEKTAKRLFAVWENTTGRTDGVDIITAYKELSQTGFKTYAEYEEDFLHDMDSTFRGVASKTYAAAEKGKDFAEVVSLREEKRGVELSIDTELTERQVQKLAEYTKKKVFTKAETEKIVNELMDGYMNYEDEVGSLRGKTRAEVVKMLWRGLNSAEPGKRTGMAKKVAEYIIQHTVMENIYSDSVVQAHSHTLDMLKPYLHKLDLDGIKGDIRYHYGDNSPYARWGKRKGEKGIGIDVAALELEEKGFFIDAVNNVDIFLQIDEAYRNAVEGVKKRYTRFATEIIGEKEQKSLQGDMVKAILRSFDTHGAETELSNLLREYDKKVQGWKEKYYEERDKNNLTARVLYKVQKLTEYEKGTFANASEFKRDIFKHSIGRLARIKYRGNLNKSGTRRILAGLLEWYDNKNNPMLEGEAYNEEIAEKLMRLADNLKPMTTAQYELIAKLEEKSKAYDFKTLAEWYTRENVGKEYNRDTKEWLEDLANPKAFTAEELKDLENVIDYFKNFMETYNKVFRNGKYVEAEPLARAYVTQMQGLKRVNVGWLRKWFEKYLKSFSDPMTVARYFDKYQDGFFTSALEELRQGVIDSQAMEIRLCEPIEQFYEKHKNFIEDSEKREIVYSDGRVKVNMNTQTAMLLYMTLQREQALRGLAYSGFKFKKGDYTENVPGFATAENLDIDELRMQAAELQSKLAEQFNEAEKEYISIVEKIFNEDCKKAKSDTDMRRMGYTNISEDYYVPIRRSSIAYNVEKQSYREEIASVSNQSFNKDTVKGARNQLFIDGLTGVFEKHVGGISQYSALAVALDNYNVLFNLNLSGNPNVTMSVKSECENVWADGEKYFSELIDDIKGIKKSTGVGHKFMSAIRGGYAKYQLGGNLKVLATQFSSFGAAINILDPDCIMSGVGVGWSDKGGAEVDKYCALAKIRNTENTAAMAQGVLEKTTNKIGDVLMKPIGMVDRLVVKGLFGACQKQVEKNGGAKVGTEENKVAAGKLLEKVILETQQNAMATERSAAMRSGSEFMKAITMFSADSMKLTGRVVDGIGETVVLRKMLKEEMDGKAQADLKKRLAAANGKATRAISSVALSAVFMTAIAEAFKWLYDKDRDDDENLALSLTTDMIGNLFGGLPVIRDVHSFFADGYEVDGFAYSTINDLLTSLSDARDVAAAVLKGERLDSREVWQTARKSVYSAGQLLGIPTRNVYNMFYGLTKRFSPSTAYAWNDKLYKGAYRSDLAKAIEKGDEDMIATIVGLMLNENVGGVTDSAVRKEIDGLVQAGCDVIPRGVPTKLTCKVNEDGEEVQKELVLSAANVKAFNKVYTKANEAAASLVKLTGYKNADQDVQAAAIGFVYDTYYDMAKNTLLEDAYGVDIVAKNTLFAAAIDIDKLAVAVATARALKADLDRKGEVISGSKKSQIEKYVNSLRLTAVQKYMIMGYLGYTNKNGADTVKAYISRLNLTENEKSALYKYSGYGN